MAVETRRTSGALDVADIWKVVLSGTWTAGDTITFTVGNRSLVMTAGSTVTTAALATALTEMWNGDSITGDNTRSDTGDNVPEFAEATASIGATTSTVLITMNTAGIPLGFSASRTTASSGAITVTNPTVASGSQFWGGAANWSNGVPAAGDTVYFDNASGSVRYGLDQSAVTVAALYIDQSFTGELGLPATNDNGYPEYREQYLKIGSTILKVGRGSGTGSQRLKINTGSVQTALTVYATGTSADELPALQWKGTNSSNALVMSGGSVGVALFGSETATLATVNKSGGDLTTGAGVTLSGALTHGGGTWVINSAVATSLTQTSGASVTINGTGAVASLELQGGECVYNTTGTLGGSTVVGGDATLDFSQNPVVVQVTNPIDGFGQNARIIDSLRRVWDGSTALKLVVDGNSGFDPGTQVVWGPNSRLSRAATA